MRQSRSSPSTRASFLTSITTSYPWPRRPNVPRYDRSLRICADEMSRPTRTARSSEVTTDVPSRNASSSARWYRNRRGSDSACEFLGLGRRGIERLARSGHRLLDVGFAVRQADERGLELRRRQIDAAFEHSVEEARVGGRVGEFRTIEIDDRVAGEEQRPHRSDARDARRDAAFAQRARQAGLERDAAALEPVVDVAALERAQLCDA